MSIWAIRKVDDTTNHLFNNGVFVGETIYLTHAKAELRWQFALYWRHKVRSDENTDGRRNDFIWRCLYLSLLVISSLAYARWE